MDEPHQFQLRKKSYTSSGIRGKPILVTSKRKTVPNLNIFYDGKEVTPKPLNPELFTSGRERQLSVYDIGLDRLDRLEGKPSEGASLNVFKSQSTVRFKTELGRHQVETSTQYIGSLLYASNYFDVFLPYSSSDEPASVSIDTLTYSEEDSVLEMKIPTRISLVLTETNTVFLLDIPSATEIKDTEEGKLAQEDNDQYDYLTKGKGKNRKVVHAEVQTVPIIMKSRNTLCKSGKTKTGDAFASNWDMYDTFQTEVEVENEASEQSDESDVEIHKLDDISSIDSYRISADEKMLNKLMKNIRFLEAVCVIERLLANNRYNEQQKIFRGLGLPDDFRENIEYKYKLNILWTLANDDTKGKSVNALHWNPVNKDILAVGYGKFYFTDNLSGLVLIWNIKNPVQPERQYSFKEPVTSLNFSVANPMLLAVGFYNGSIIVMNIVSREKIIIGGNTPTFEPVWRVSWHFDQSGKKGDENLCATFDDGRICAYSVQRKFEALQLMRVAKADGKLKGYDVMRRCSSLSIPVSRYAAALMARKHPGNPSIYFVATNEGAVHKCSTNYLNQHLDLFLAHDGPINELQFSPFSKKIFATCGDDWHTRIWAEGISEPLLEFYVSMQSEQGLDWSPTHSTILVTIRGQYIQIWDIQRKVYEPQSITASPTGSRNTVVQFTSSGRCLVVGDVEGNVHFFALEDMPFPAFFQENLLFESLARALITNPELLNKVKKLVRHVHGEKIE